METMMKPFNLEEAKAGKPVCTRDGRKVRILCTDLAETIFPIVAAVTCDNGREDIFRHKTCGSHYLSGTSSVDLFMVADKHEGWVNIYRIGNGVTLGYICKTQEEALLITKAQNAFEVLATVKIEWEE